MSKLTLYIGNKNYSSWSFRPWIALEGCGIAFEEVLIPFDFPAGNPNIREVSPTGKVPMLVHDGFKVWESLAIIEYVAELFPDAGLLPKDRQARALARSYSMEMLSGFGALRNACPMDMRRPVSRLDLPEGVTEDVARIETIWREARSRSGGPFLFGTFSGADAMFAPVVSRLERYDIAVSADTRNYMAVMKALPAWKKWEEAALKETWIVPEDEA
ncbi:MULTISPECIES: glutathione S-transferase family protein [unclassified Rhizobium]|uniref:glutathione S-transferase N-terminal domain-containing protein n=1 Tax=unclassified Rhizobium TaxID=2613769 RepID=UPI000DDEA385|nr:glutathione S-transferase [Rhizobium sp. BK252]MBB3401412.1 glutathione S-transferase [Rhizobium sp. BK289]MBB3413990.1 glutathione S-transferase [Rhizobium sp. BK284]MBB3481877.1 glutathione S-transferase [Rhizobium sp. BK347]